MVARTGDHLGRRLLFRKVTANDGLLTSVYFQLLTTGLLQQLKKFLEEKGYTFHYLREDFIIIFITSMTNNCRLVETHCDDWYGCCQKMSQNGCPYSLP